MFARPARRAAVREDEPCATPARLDHDHELTPCMDMPQSANLPSDLFEALVAGWTEILYADYLRRHPVSNPGLHFTRSGITAGDSRRAAGSREPQLNRGET